MEIDLSRLSAEDQAVTGELLISDGKGSGGDSSLAAQGIRFPEPFRVDAVARRPDREIEVAGQRIQCAQDGVAF